jgi:hypothetical protein
MKATKPYDGWTKWAFVICNDPEFIWSTDPSPEPNMNDFDSWGIWSEGAMEFFHHLKGDPLWGYRLVKACRKVGYRPDRHGSLGYWLWDRMGKLIQTEGYKVNVD